MYKETIGNRKHGLENKSAFDASNTPRFHVVGSWVLDEVSRYILLFFLAIVLSSQVYMLSVSNTSSQLDMP